MCAVSIFLGLTGWWGKLGMQKSTYLGYRPDHHRSVFLTLVGRSTAQCGPSFKVPAWFEVCRWCHTICQKDPELICSMNLIWAELGSSVLKFCFISSYPFREGSPWFYLKRDMNEWYMLETFLEHHRLLLGCLSLTSLTISTHQLHSFQSPFQYCWDQVWISFLIEHAGPPGRSSYCGLYYLIDLLDYGQLEG